MMSVMNTIPLSALITTLILGAGAPCWAEPLADSPTDSPSLKSPVKALGVALGSTAGLVFTGTLALGMQSLVHQSRMPSIVGVSLMGLGVVFAPSAGHFYAGEVGRGLLTSGLRMVGYGGGGALISVGIIGYALGGHEAEGTCTGLLVAGGLLSLGALGLTIYDIVDAPRAARRANHKRHMALTVAPLLVANERETRWGLGVGGIF